MGMQIDISRRRFLTAASCVTAAGHVTPSPLAAHVQNPATRPVEREDKSALPAIEK
jgi:hypothetical protein